MLPLLPREVFNSILSYALSPTTSPRSPAEPVFLQPRSPRDTSFLASLILAFGKRYSQWVQEILWKEITLQSGKMVEKLNYSLQNANSTLKARKVKVLHLEVQEYPRLSSPLPSYESHTVPAGVDPSQIKKLASLLFTVETLCLRASPSGAWFFNFETCEALTHFVNRQGFRNLEVDSKHLGYPSIFYLFYRSPHLRILKIKNVKPTWHRTPFHIPGSPEPLPPSTLPPYSTVPDKRPPFANHLESLVISDCTLLSHNLASLLSSIILEKKPTALSTLVLNRLDFKSDTQKLLNTLFEVIPYLTSLQLALQRDGFKLQDVTPLKFDAAFFKGSSRLRSVTLPAASLFGTLSTHDNFLLLLNSLHHLVPLSLTLVIDSTWDPLRQPRGVSEELARIIDNYWLRELEFVAIVGGRSVGAKALKGEDDLRRRIDLINEERKEFGQRSLKLRIC